MTMSAPLLVGVRTDGVGRSFGWSGGAEAAAATTMTEFYSVLLYR